MDFDQVFKILEYALPILAALIGAKIVNKNSLPWHLWGGRIARILGLAITATDALRHPKKYVQDLAPDAIRKKVDKAKSIKKFTTGSILLLLLSGCAGWQFTGKTWQETARVNIGNIAMVTSTFEQHGMPVFLGVCKSLQETCLTQSKHCDEFGSCVDAAAVTYDALDEVDDYLRLAEIAVAVGDEGKFEDHFVTVTQLVAKIVAKLSQYGAL